MRRNQEARSLVDAGSAMTVCRFGAQRGTAWHSVTVCMAQRRSMLAKRGLTQRMAMARQRRGTVLEAAAQVTDGALSAACFLPQS